MALLALSLSGGLEKIGAYAGLAAVIGLGILSLLYFSQAREVKRLREWAGGAPERAQRIEQRDAEGGQPAPAAAPSRPAPSAPAAAPVTAATTVSTSPAVQRRPASARPPGQAAPPGGGSGAALRIAPAGTGGPALASATPFPALLAARAAQPAEPPEAPTTAQPAPEAEPPAAPESPPEGAPAGSPPAPPSAPLPAALTAAAAARPRPEAPDGGTGAGTATPDAPGPTASGQPATAPPARANGRSTEPPPRPRTIPPGGSARRPPAAPASRRAAPARAASASPSRDFRARRWAIAGLVVGLLVLAAGVFGLTQLLGGDDSGSKSSSSTASASSGSHKGTHTGSAFSRGSVTVAVLNGTPVAGLASEVADRLTGQGFKQGAVTNASDQARSATIISYFPDHRRDAVAVRSALKAGAIEPVDDTTRAIVCPDASNCNDSVVVTVGSDLPR